MTAHTKAISFVTILYNVSLMLLDNQTVYKSDNLSVHSTSVSKTSCNSRNNICKTHKT